jgi:hypothetical protein
MLCFPNERRPMPRQAEARVGHLLFHALAAHLHLGQM